MKIIHEGQATRVGILEQELRANRIGVRYDLPLERREIEPIEVVHIALEIAQQADKIKTAASTLHAKLSAISS